MYAELDALFTPRELSDIAEREACHLLRLQHEAALYRLDICHSLLDEAGIETGPDITQRVATLVGRYLAAL
jgi:hypothetical protein